MVQYHNIEQGTPEWFEIRKGKLTASNATAIGANGAGLVTYCKEIVLELIGIEKEQYTNADIERGNELESIARASYEFQTGYEVEQVGFITNSNFLNTGMSPDGLIGLDGGCEIKARNAIKHLSLILGETKEIPFNQIQMSLMVSERKWWDFISINTGFKNPLFVKRIYPDLKYFEKLKAGIIEGNKLIENMLNTYKNKNHERISIN